MPGGFNKGVETSKAGGLGKGSESPAFGGGLGKMPASLSSKLSGGTSFGKQASLDDFGNPAGQESKLNELGQPSFGLGGPLGGGQSDSPFGTKTGLGSSKSGQSAFGGGGSSFPTQSVGMGAGPGGKSLSFTPNSLKAPLGGGLGKQSTDLPFGAKQKGIGSSTLGQSAFGGSASFGKQAALDDFGNPGKNEISFRMEMYLYSQRMVFNYKKANRRKS